MTLVGEPTTWAPTSQHGVIRDYMLPFADAAHVDKSCHTCNSVHKVLKQRLGTAPFVFRTRNEFGDWVEMPHGVARSQRLKTLIYQVHKALEGAPMSAPMPAPAPVTPAPVAVTRDGESQREAEATIRWIQTELRPFCEARNADGKPFDQIGLRPAQNAAKMLTSGISLTAIQHALTLHYPPEARRALGVKGFDATTFEARNWGPVTVPSDVKAHSGQHRALPYVVALASAGVPIALVGPPGTGKTTLASQLATELGFGPEGFGMVSMTRATSPSAFNGRPRIASDGTAALVQALIARGEIPEALKVATAASAQGDVVESQFVRIFRNGGVFLFDEMDASEPNLLLLVNAALANGTFSNSATGEMVKASRKFVPIAGMNTLGLGGDRAMVGRERQDAAALDRWHAGRVEILLDTKLESHLFWAGVTA